MQRKNVFNLSDDEITELFQKAVSNSISENRKKGNPVCGYDIKLRKSYILYPDGRKEYSI